MSSFQQWLARVLLHGESVQERPPALEAQERGAVLEELRTAFGRHALEVAGPAVAFHPEASLGSAVVLARACWSLASGEGEERLRLKVGCEPASASAHLSADVVLRFLPTVYRRARARDAAGRLTAELERLLRAWPLSGVLADLDGGPTTPLDFQGHPGLQLLYAERLATVGRAGWVPNAGAARDWAERVYHERKAPVPVLVESASG